ncbi:MAG: XRE family transcriptional regulator [Actinomycetota bacterium]
MKRLRDAKGLSLRDLAREAGVSAPMLSQVERGETSPTLVVATKIASGLGLPLSQLLRLDEEPNVAVVRRADRRTVKRDGHRFDELTPSLPGQPHTVTVHTLRAGGVTGGADDPPLHEPGSRETAIVSSGAVVLVHGKETYELSDGDAVTFDADVPHHFENRGKRESTFIAIVTTGLRRA